MSPTFEQAVEEALAAIPHDAKCESLQFHVPGDWAGCDCDREQRIAQRVAAAIEAARESSYESAGEEIDRQRWAHEAALRALGGHGGSGE